MKQILKVKISDKNDKSYTISISDEDIYATFKQLENIVYNRKCLIVISKKVYNLYKNYISFDNLTLVIIEDGENQKNLKNYAKILEKAAQLKFSRKDIFVAVGGGVIGDITGFAASTYMRGIDFIQIPTTLLAMVDSSVGGKTGINLKEGKNLIGSFWQPKMVLINLNFLETLDDRQYFSGIGEILKYAFIETNCEYEKPLFLIEYLTLSAKNLIEMDYITLAKVIEYCLNLKISVVSKDEKETNLRKILNFGHTIGHAIETITRYKKYTHGEAVIYGMKCILKFAYRKGMISEIYYKQALNLFDIYDFDDEFDFEKYGKKEDYINIIQNDKKFSDEKISLIVPCEKRSVKEIKYSPAELMNELFVID